MLAGCANGQVACIDVEARQQVCVWQAHTATVYQLQWLAMTGMRASSGAAARIVEGVGDGAARRSTIILSAGESEGPRLQLWEAQWELHSGRTASNAAGSPVAAPAGEAAPAAASDEAVAAGASSLAGRQLLQPLPLVYARLPQHPGKPGEGGGKGRWLTAQVLPGSLQADRSCSVLVGAASGALLLQHLRPGGLYGVCSYMRPPPCTCSAFLSLAMLTFRLSAGPCPPPSSHRRQASTSSALGSHPQPLHLRHHNAAVTGGGAGRCHSAASAHAARSRSGTTGQHSQQCCRQQQQ